MRRDDVDHVEWLLDPRDRVAAFDVADQRDVGAGRVDELVGLVDVEPARGTTAWNRRVLKGFSVEIGAVAFPVDARRIVDEGAGKLCLERLDFRRQVLCDRLRCG